MKLKYKFQLRANFLYFLTLLLPMAYSLVSHSLVSHFPVETSQKENTVKSEKNVAPSSSSYYQCNKRSNMDSFIVESFNIIIDRTNRTTMNEGKVIIMVKPDLEPSKYYGLLGKKDTSGKFYFNVQERLMEKYKTPWQSTECYRTIGAFFVEWSQKKNSKASASMKYYTRRHVNINLTDEEISNQCPKSFDDPISSSVIFECTKSILPDESF